jgi:hypothetical protein
MTEGTSLENLGLLICAAIGADGCRQRVIDTQIVAPGFGSPPIKSLSACNVLVVSADNEE